MEYVEVFLRDGPAGDGWYRVPLEPPVVLNDTDTLSPQQFIRHANMSAATFLGP